jgi:C-8 sterol isomerase
VSRCLYLLSFVVLALAVITAVIDVNRDSFYVFDPDVLHKVAAETAKMNITAQEKISRISHELHKIYPQYIDLEEEWMFNVAGGAMGHMTLLHCSITEYVIIFGSPIGTEGFSGRFMSDDYFTIIEGEQHSYYAGEIQARIFKPGDRNLMPRGTATGYRMPVPTYALEYARGNIPTMLPFGFADTFFSTVDFLSLWQTVYHYGRITINQLLIGKI